MGRGSPSCGLPYRRSLKPHVSGFALKSRGRGEEVSHTPVTLNQIVGEARQLPTEQVVDSVDLHQPRYVMLQRAP